MGTEKSWPYSLPLNNLASSLSNNPTRNIWHAQRSTEDNLGSSVRQKIKNEAEAEQNITITHNIAVNPVRDWLLRGMNAHFVLMSFVLMSKTKLTWVVFIYN